MITQAKETKEKVVYNLRKDMAQFGINELELDERITVLYDEHHFNPKEDESVWLQKKGKAPKVCEIYFDDIWCCDLHQEDTHTKFILKFLKGFLKGYESGKIRLNRELAIAEEEAKKAAEKQADKELIKSIEDLPENSVEDKLSKDIIKEIKKDEDDAAIL